MVRARILNVMQGLVVIVSIILIGLNVYGNFALINDLSVVKGAFRDDSTLSYEQYSSKLCIIENEYSLGVITKMTFVEELTYLVSDRFLHKTFTEVEDKFGQRLRIYDNYVLFLFHLFNDRTSYFYDDPNKAAKRGFGQCGQQSHTLMKILERNGIDSYLIGLYGHVVTGALIEDKEVIMDADYGIFIPISLDELKKIDIENYYHLQNFYVDSTTYYIGVNDMINLYMSKGDNWRSTERTVTVGVLYQKMELISSWLKWLIPIGCLVYLIIPSFKR